MANGNPLFKDDLYRDAVNTGTETMTVAGTVNKTFILLALLLSGAVWSWSRPEMLMPNLLLGSLGAFIIAIVTVMKKEWAGFTAPLYSIMEGVLIGALSSMMEMRYPGIVMQAVMLTFGTLFALLTLYRLNVIRATDTFKKVVFAATAAVAVTYLVSMLMGFFGRSIPLIHEGGKAGIIFSLIVVGVAALNLVIDFDFIENGERAKAPKYLEWYGAFGLMVTMIWLYMEILRLLSKMRKR